MVYYRLSNNPSDTLKSFRHSKESDLLASGLDDSFPAMVVFIASSGIRRICRMGINR